MIPAILIKDVPYEDPSTGLAHVWVQGTRVTVDLDKHIVVFPNNDMMEIFRDEFALIN